MNNKKQIPLRLPEDLLKKVDDAAWENRMSRNGYVLHLIQNWGDLRSVILDNKYCSGCGKKLKKKK